MGEEESACCNFFHSFCPLYPKRITKKIFRPPLPPYYELKIIDAKLFDFAFLLSPEADNAGLRLIQKQRARFIKTSLNNNIAVLYINCNQEKKYTILYSHGNDVDLGKIHKVCAEISVVCKCDVVSYDYCGYGQSEGKPTEANLYADIKAAWDYTLAFHEPSANKIILYGQSLGTAAVIDLAAKVQCAGVILQSPFKSSLSVFYPSHKKLCFCLDRLKK